MRIFDTDGNGDISFSEFCNLLRFCVLMTTVEGGDSEDGNRTVCTSFEELLSKVKSVFFTSYSIRS
jgi:Ca2+-binding EF-hand superfamily protein